MNHPSSLIPHPFGLLQALFLVIPAQSVDHFAQVARDDGVELVPRLVDAMVGDAILREVVGADALAAVAGADQALALGGTHLVQFFPLIFKHSAAKDTYRSIVILALAAFILAFHFHLIGGAFLVPDADSAFGLIDVLAPCPA